MSAISAINNNVDHNHPPLLAALVAECIHCSPNSWQFGTLQIECNGYVISYQLKNSQSRHFAKISAELKLLCEEFYFAKRELGDTWQSATIEYFLQDGDWRFEIQYVPVQAAKPNVVKLVIHQALQKWRAKFAKTTRI